MKKDIEKELNKEIKEEDNLINEGIVGIEEKISNNKKYYWLTIVVVIAAIGALIGILVATGNI